MSKNLSDEAIISFDAMVKEAYQGERQLAGTVRTKENVVGATHQFPKVGKGLAKRRPNPYADVIPMNLAYSHATATLLEYDASDYSNIWDNQVVPFDEKALLAQAIRRAIERRKDQQIIDALDAASSAYTVSIDLGGTSSGLNVTKLRRADRLLGDNGVPSADRHFAGSHIGKEDLLGQTQITSADYNSVRALVNGEINSFLGFNYHWIEARDEGGLTLAAHHRQNFAYHKDAVGLADSGLGDTVEVNYVPVKKSWLNSQGFKAGAVAIDNAGIVELDVYES